MSAAKDQADVRAGARGLTHDSHGAPARKLSRITTAAACTATAIAAVVGVATAQAAMAAPTPYTNTWTGLAPQNGWFDYGNGTAAPSATNISGIVHLKGAIATSSSNSNSLAFTLPVGDRPSTEVFVSMGTNAGVIGRLDIMPDGTVHVENGAAGGYAQALTSLDGVSFATSPTSFTKLTLTNGWTKYVSTSPTAGVRNINGIVHFRGAIKTGGINPVPFTLPAGFRPNHTVNVTVNLCDAGKGDLKILTSGQVSVNAQGGQWGNAQCFTSLDGAWFATSSTSYTQLALHNGWHNYGNGTATAAVRNISGIIHLEGAIATSGVNTVAFTLPTGFRPSHTVWAPVDMTQANPGHIRILPSGQVNVYPAGNWSDAQTMTSLAGVSFAP